MKNLEDKYENIYESTNKKCLSKVPVRKRLQGAQII